MLCNITYIRFSLNRLGTHRNFNSHVYITQLHITDIDGVLEIYIIFSKNFVIKFLWLNLKNSFKNFFQICLMPNSIKFAVILLEKKPNRYTNCDIFCVFFSYFYYL